MFDWEGEEITNIIWGEEGENKDHIVPYPAETYGKPNKEAANAKLIQNTAVFDNITDSGQENNAKSGKNGRGSSDEFSSLLDLSSSTMDHEHTDEKAQEDNGSQNFDNQGVDRDRSNFVDYDWANVGSFDDLDRMLRNHDLELWPSTKDVIGCSENPEMLSINSQSLNLADIKSNNYLHFETKSGVIKEEKQTNDSGGHKMKIEVEGRSRQHSKISCLSNQETESFGCTQFINACPSPRDYSMHSASAHQQVSYLSDRSPLSMTPQEKIEKLRRRQQMRALLAIRKKQQEIRHQDDFSNLHIESHHRMQFSRSGRVEVDQSQSDSDGRHVMMDKTAMADTTVQQFQNVIAGLGIQMRVCIRDSLFRLAQGALQRKNDGTTNKRSNVVLEGVSSRKRHSSTRTPDAETKTNPIDRLVAGLLLHTLPRPQSPSTIPTMEFFRL